MAASIEISRRSYGELLTDNPSLGKNMVPEYLDYYTTALLWLRIVNLKEQNSQELTFLERQLLTLTKNVSFCVPEPLRLLVNSYGNIETKIGTHLVPAFPQLPDQVIANIGGYYGQLLPPAEGVNNGLHNLYEEIPCLGVLATAVQAVVSDAAPGPYPSPLVYQGQQPNNNLLGFRHLSRRVAESKTLATNQGITPHAFPDYPVDTGFNLDLLQGVSDVLSTTSTFTLHQIVFSGLGVNGARSQIVIERPNVVVIDPDRPAVSQELRPTSLADEPESVFGSGIFFCQQLLKVTVENNNLSWALYPQIPPEWVANQNQRRTLRDVYLSPRFDTVPLNANMHRMAVIKRMVNNPR